MKKLSTITATILLCSITIAQNDANKKFESIKNQLTQDSNLEKIASTQPLQNKKAAGDTIWSENFTNGFPAGWSAYDSTGNNYDWVLNSGPIDNSSATPVGYTNSSAIASESGGNYMLLFSDEYNRVATASGTTPIEMDAYFQTTAIPINGQQGILVNWQQKYRTCCSITPPKQANLWASTDPTFTTNVFKYDILGGIPASQQSPDPMNMSINISDIAGGLNGNIYLRFYIESGISHYFWMIDDIHIVESPANDIEIPEASYSFDGYPYTRIPASQINPINFSIKANNWGHANQTGSNATVDIDDGSGSIFNNSSNNITINSFSADTFLLNNFWTPPTSPGITYTPTLSVFSDSLDETPSNNTRTLHAFTVTNNILAVDDFSTTPGSFGGVSEYEAGNYFKIFNTQDLYAIDVVTGSGTPIGTAIDAVLYQADKTTTPVTFTEVWRSQPYSVTASDIETVHQFTTGNGTQITNLTAGETYFAAIHSIANYKFATSGNNNPYSFFGFASSSVRYPNMTSSNSLLHLTTKPMIRLNFENTVGIVITNTSTSFSISPNPTSGKFTITLDSDLKENYSLDIKNAIGQTILTKKLMFEEGLKEEISLVNHKKGIYFISLTNSQGTKTSKIIVE